MEKEMSPMTTEILKKGYLLFPIPRRYTRFGVSLWDMPDPDNGNVDTHWTYGGYEYAKLPSNRLRCSIRWKRKCGRLCGQSCVIVAGSGFFVLCLQKGYTEVLLQGSDSSESRCVLKCYYL